MGTRRYLEAEGPTPCPQCRGRYGHKLDCTERDKASTILPMSELAQATHFHSRGYCSRCRDTYNPKAPQDLYSLKGDVYCSRCWAYKASLLQPVRTYDASSVKVYINGQELADATELSFTAPPDDSYANPAYWHARLSGRV